MDNSRIGSLKAGEKIKLNLRGKVMGIIQKIFRKKTKKNAAVANNILVGMMQQHIAGYPHSYFLRKAPKHFNFRGR